MHTYRRRCWSSKISALSCCYRPHDPQVVGLPLAVTHHGWSDDFPAAAGPCH